MREIRDGLAAQGQRQPGPVVERRVGDLVAAEAAGGVGQRDVADLAAPAFDQRHRERVRRRRREFASAVRRPAGAAELLAQELAGALDLQPAHAGAGKDIATRPDRHRHLGEAMPAGRMIVAHVAHQAAGARRRADQADLRRLRPVTRCRRSRSAPHRRRIPQPGDRLLDVGQRARQPLAAAAPRARVRDRGGSRRAAPGRGRSGCRRAAR